MPLRITIYGEEVLRRKASKVEEFTPALKALATEMLGAMAAANGVGLAAEQVGETCAMCVIDVPRDCERKECVEFNSSIAMPLVMVNPKITARDGKQRDEEGCLSFPEIGAPITRSMQVTARYQDLDGAEHEITARGLLARAIQHELDHLDGVLLVDRMSPLQRVAVAGQLKRLQKQAAGK